MEDKLKLHMVLLGASPKGRLTEQHDIFFGIGTSVQDMAADIYAFWPNAGPLHIDSWREITQVVGYDITVVPKDEKTSAGESLFFINLGGYKPNEFEEYHYKVLAVATSMGNALKASKKTAFYKHYNFEGPGVSHVDDKYGIDVDDMVKVTDILAPHLTAQYSISIQKADTAKEDELHIGYTKLPKRR